MTAFGNDLVSGLDAPFQRLVHSVTDYAIFLLDPSGRILSWNLGAQQIKGYAPEEILGRHFSIFYPPQALERDWPGEALRLAAANGRLEDEGWRVRKDGSLFWASVVITALRGPNGELRAFAKITRDLTGRRRDEQKLRESEQRFRALVESVRDYAIFMLDAEGRVASWNPGAERINGYGAEEILGRHFSVFYPEEARLKQWPEHELKVALEEGRFEEEGLRVRKDGSTFWANVVISPVHDSNGAHAGFAKVTRDLTDLQRIRSLEEAGKRTNEFLAMLAHELRNPLAPIRNALHLLSKKPTTDPTELWVREVLQRQTRQMARLVDDLLDVSRITRAAVTLSRQRIDVLALLRESVDASLQWMQARHQELSVRLPQGVIEIDADAVRLSQVIQNLLHNAAKFTPRGGKIELSAALETDGVAIHVKDNGIGMTPEVAASAFEMFSQGHQGIDRHEGGLGVGLTLVQRLVGLHGGTVQAHSEGAGKGSEFVVRLPLAREPGAQATPSSAAAASLASQRRILIVDDNADAANALRYLLENDGHHVELASDGSSGLALAHRLKPDVLLLDIGLPRLNGYDFARQVRSDEALKNATLIAITGYGQPGDQLRAVKAGFDHHMTKPIEFQQLQELLRSG